ncbi:MAG: isoprenylcysteine carboxylmethyltransferase family protein [Alphaproteobacteria bacterium]|nr:isoprenylcysteine carboxylmethyltransferase family protein [Alphaproteobacteria bacterium]
MDNKYSEIRRLFEAPKLKAPQVFTAAIGMMLALHLIEPGAQLIVKPWVWLGGIPAGAGLLLTMWAIGVLEVHQTSSGLGVNTWADRMFKHYRTQDRSISDITTLVTVGPFGFSRHPMFLGMALAVFGLGVVLGSATPMLVVVVFPLILDQRYMGAEETILEDTFGDAYRDYKNTVRRWL